MDLDEPCKQPIGRQGGHAPRGHRAGLPADWAGHGAGAPPGAGGRLAFEVGPEAGRAEGVDGAGVDAGVGEDLAADGTLNEFSVDHLHHGCSALVRLTKNQGLKFNNKNK